MTREQFLAKIVDLCGTLNETAAQKAEYMLKTGCVDVGSYDDNYELPKLAMVAICRSLADQFLPPRPTPKQKEEIENISIFI